MVTVHANSAREALVKLCTLPLLAGENIGARFVVPTVASTVDIVVQVAIDSDGRRRVREIVGVPGRVESDIIETEPIFTWKLGGLHRAHGMPPRLENFAAHGIEIHDLLGVDAQLADASGG
jgi:pilus assembly protein CpaF